MFLLAWKLIDTRSPLAPMRSPCQLAPIDCAASSSTRSRWRRAIAYRRVAIHRQARQIHRQQRARRGVIAASMRARSMLRVRGSTSTNTGCAPARTITLAVATQDSGVVMTSSPGPTPASASADLHGRRWRS